MKITNIFKREKTKLEMEIENVLLDMESMIVDSDEYAKAIEHLAKLYELRVLDKKINISPDTLAVVGGNLLGILLILKHEELNVITSKAMGFVIRGRA